MLLPQRDRLVNEDINLLVSEVTLNWNMRQLLFDAELSECQKLLEFMIGVVAEFSLDVPGNLLITSIKD